MAYRFVASSAFDNFIMTCIVLNTIVVGLKMFPEPTSWFEDMREIVNYVFAVVFFFEMVVKLFALRRNYFSESWNIFDFCTVWATVIGFIVSMAGGAVSSSALSAIRSVRIARLFRLVRFLKGLNRLFRALL